ncbi:FMN-binding protein [Streptomyces turgidiscabies]|uniref:FMN-binding domain protein n=1 Tax=Streptomyces turgidiscabies (strain Car8) TaxID=698760 RepID=L7ETU8_STRT8|nr:FMN-binding protein [Streptomyces turgidiscabies]ELP61825.1 FMN-binding domain protein [Streptomyces turgidiscabies Car8]GAQ71560.1 Na(+)-translocating NADH-quinone reductase [Streptomyces turgidiscabies]
MKKSHPFRRVMLASAATVSGIVLLLTLKPSSDPGSAQAAGALPQQTSAAQESAQGGAAAKDGTFTGDTVQTQYGPVQVRVTVSGGKITKAEALQQPKGGQSDQISGNAIPKLNKEAVTAGLDGTVDAISGASYTSAGYGKSLQSALDKASAGASTGATGGGGAAQAATVTGDAVDTQYGQVQVRITVSGGKITKAEAVKAPTGGQSTTISGDAVPKLNQEAVAAGTADIDAISGASYTSAGYKKSLQSALDKVPAAESDKGTATGASSSDPAASSPAGSGAAGSGAAKGGATSDGGGTYTGSVIQTEYGPVQVRVTLTNGRITSASAVQAPKGGRSDQVSGDAIPKLNQEAVTAGDGDIDAVSGASYTSAGYKKSLQSALDQAGG